MIYIFLEVSNREIRILDIILNRNEKFNNLIKLNLYIQKIHYSIICLFEVLICYDLNAALFYRFRSLE